jgi:hypothetical protein
LRTPKRSDATPQCARSEDVELHIRATLAEARLADLKATLDDMRGQRDNWQTIAQRLAITDQRSTQRPSQSVQPWWSHLAGIWTQLQRHRLEAARFLLSWIKCKNPESVAAQRDRAAGWIWYIHGRHQRHAAVEAFPQLL